MTVATPRVQRDRSLAAAEPRRPEIISEIVARRRSIGLGLVALGVATMAAQGLIEWILPYDLMALQRVQATLGPYALSPQGLALNWALISLFSLLALHWVGQKGRGATLVAFAAGLAIGCCRLAAGGVVGALLILLLTGVASLGWQARRGGGLGLLLGTTLAICAWDFLLSSEATLWAFVIPLALLFVGIDRFHLQANDKRLARALDEQQRLIGDLDAKREHLLILQEARTRLLAGISHDLRQPLQAVRLYGEAVLSRPGDAGNGLLLQRQLRAADDAVGMLDQFSDFSAIDQGALSFHPQPVEVRALLDDIAEQLRTTTDARLIDLRVHGRPHWLMADRLHLARVVQNLAGNAVRYSLQARAGVKARVVLAVRPQGAGLCIDVIDNGRGIAADKLELAFEPYVQLHDIPLARSGQGLGLAIVRSLAQRLEMPLAPVRSAVDRGTRFRLLIPAQLLCSAPEAPLAPPANGLADDAPLWVGSRVIAILEDNDDARRALATALEAVGAHCIAAASFEELRERVADDIRLPDALVFDLDLGAGPNGLEAVTLLRADWELTVPAVIVSGRSMAARALQAPVACSVLNKPASVADISRALANSAARADTAGAV